MKQVTILLLLFTTATISAEATKPPRWESVREQTSCEVVAPGSCIGEYGFTVDATGQFTAGPSPGGLRVDGKLPPNELLDLQRAVRAALRHANAAENCIASRNIPGSTERLTITTTNGREHVVYRRESPSQLCFAGDRTAATHLHDVMQRLMAEHYPQHFPQ